MITFALNTVISIILLLQLYASYKVLAQRPAETVALEHMVIYWSIIAILLPLFSLLDVFISWLPLYSSFKALFLLLFAIPHTQAALWLYLSVVEPWLRLNETHIDAKMGEVKTEIVEFGKGKARDTWSAMLGTLGQQPAPSVQPIAAPPTLSDPISGPLQLVGNFWRSYGPVLATMAATSGLLNPQPATAPSQQPSSSSNRDERRRQLEAELASLRSADREDDDGVVPDHVLMTPSSSSDATFTSSRPAPHNGLRGRTQSNRALEESDDDDDGVGYDYRRQSGASGAKEAQTWLGGWFSPSSSTGYEKAKND
ncbi:hypothetical protein DL96DRAFT_1815266 [Flagelloscypha sp. PMI_526]|nr:hypothetical protein DL96DRAFT_1815266 [Flagelloscypha sp. PMI_526]